MRLDRLNRLVRDGETLEGEWELTPSHQLRYRRRAGEEEVALAGDLVSAGPNELTFRFQKEARGSDTRRRELSLKGRWQADAKNRLRFLLEGERGPQKVLTFEGAWELGPGNEILYRFNRAHSRSRTRSLHQIRFDGYWEVGSDRRLAYVLDGDTDSAFRFRGSFQTASIQQKKGALRYQIGVEGKGRSRRLQTITLFGKWKISRDLSLEFEVPYSGGFKKTITFGAAYSWDDETTVSVRLTAPGGGSLGIELALHREFLKGNGEAFVRLRRSLDETAAEAGARVRW